MPLLQSTPCPPSSAIAERSTLLTDLDSVRALIPAWRELLSDSLANEPVLSPEWLLTWWEVFGPHQGRQLRFGRFDLGDQLIGLAPLLLRRHRYRRGISFRRLECLASGEDEPEAICSDYLSLVARRGHESKVVNAFVQALVRGGFGAWDELVIPLMDGTGPMPDLLVGAASRAGLWAEQTITTQAPFIPLPGTWEEYLRLLGKKERYLVQRSLRDFEQWANGEWHLHRASTPPELEQGRHILQTLHHERWQGTGAGVFRSERFLAFHEAVMPRLLERGALELIWLIVRAEPVAAMYNIQWRGKTYFYQCGRKLDLPRNIRPGGVLLYQAIRRAIEAGRSEFDFLGGEALYKKQLALASRPLVQVRLARPSLVETARRLVECGKDALRPLWRRLRRRKTPPGEIEARD